MKYIIKKSARPCKDESQKIINFLLESYNSNSKKAGRRQMTNDPNSNQVTQKFKNLQKEQEWRHSELHV